MFSRLFKIFEPSTRKPAAVTKLLIPDPAKVVAGFSIWLRSLRKPDDDWTALNTDLKTYWDDLAKRGMKRNEAGIPFDSPFTEEISRQLCKLKREPHFKGTATLDFQLRQDVTPGWEWYEIRPASPFNPPLDSRKFTCRADLMPQDLQWFGGGFISEKSKAILENSGLTGLQFNWIQDLGRYRANQWYHAMATEPLGRGLDNPLADPAKILFPDHIKKWYSYESWRFGQYRVAKNNIGKNATIGISLADQILGCAPSLEVSVNGFRQMLRSFIPSTDFAYVWDYGLRPSICCNARAHAALVDNAILSKSDFIPIWIWDVAPENAVVLDVPNVSSFPPFPMVPPDWKQFQEQLPKKWEAFLNNPKPTFIASFDDVFQSFFKILHKDAPSTADALKCNAPSASKASNATKIPRIWERFLEVSDDFWVNTDKNEREGFVYGYEVIPISQLEEFNESQRHLVRQACVGRSVKWDEFNFVHFAGSDGDSLSFDMSKVTPEGDCKVVEWKHDSLGVGREWPSLIQLLAESIELAESENQSD